MRCWPGVPAASDPDNRPRVRCIRRRTPPGRDPRWDGDPVARIVGAIEDPSEGGGTDVACRQGEVVSLLADLDLPELDPAAVALECHVPPARLILRRRHPAGLLFTSASSDWSASRTVWPLSRIVIRVPAHATSIVFHAGAGRAGLAVGLLYR